MNKIFALAAGAAIGVNAYNSVQVTVDGAPKTLYVATSKSSASGNTLGLPYNTRGVLMTSNSMDPNAYFKPNLLGGSVEYDVNLSTRNCGCIGTIYLVRAPGKDGNGNLWNTDGYYYCDANQVDGNYCPEFDIMEANQWAFQTTAHSCSAPNNKGFYSNCNRGGTCIQNNIEKVGYNDYGPGSQFKINTQQEFHVRLDFNKNGAGQFGSFVIYLSQGGNTVVMNADCGSNADMTDDISGNMAFVVSSWSTFDSWLWKDRCGAQACNGADMYFKNISIRTGGAGPGPTPVPTPAPPTPGNYDFGGECGSKDNDFCDGRCLCKWSWPHNDPAQWGSKDAACRCAPGALLASE